MEMYYRVFALSEKKTALDKMVNFYTHIHNDGMHPYDTIHGHNSIAYTVPLISSHLLSLTP